MQTQPQLENFITLGQDIVKTVTINDGKISKEVDLVKIAYYFTQGYDIIDIARIMDIPRHNVATIMRGEEFQAVMNAISIEVVHVARMFLASAGIKAVRTVIDCMDSPNDKIRLNAATEVLNRIGVTEPKKIEVIAEGTAFQNMSDEQMLEVLRHGMDELKMLHGPAYDEEDEGEEPVDDSE